MNPQEIFDYIIGALFVMGFLVLVVIGIISLEKSEMKKREYLEEKKRYYNNINKSLEKENEFIKEIEK